MTQIDTSPGHPLLEFDLSFPYAMLTGADFALEGLLDWLEGTR